MSELKMVIPTKSLILPVAIPGSGKTTLLKQIHLPGFRWGPDDVRRACFGDVSIQGHGDLVHRAAQAMLRCRLADGLSSAYDATNVTPNTRKVIVDIAREYGYYVVAFVSDVSKELALARNSDREVGRVPEHVIERMWKQKESSIKDIAGEVDRVYRFDHTTMRLRIEWT
jgi:protein phosphatase